MARWDFEELANCSRDTVSAIDANSMNGGGCGEMAAEQRVVLDNVNPNKGRVMTPAKTTGAAVAGLLDRITFDKNILTGKPIIRGMRISVDMILELLAKGAAAEEILQDYPQLEADDPQAALLYAHHLVAGETIG